MNFPISGSSRRMGRPSLSVKPIIVRLSERTIERIDALMGKNKRSQFLREAAENELERREAAKTAEVPENK
ncbi:metal-responsive CopG/Arc/MetJ family transcriptional regulator [Bradyrhizobium sp. JR1.7]